MATGGGATARRRPPHPCQGALGARISVPFTNSTTIIEVRVLDLSLLVIVMSASSTCIRINYYVVGSTRVYLFKNTT